MILILVQFQIRKLMSCDSSNVLLGLGYVEGSMENMTKDPLATDTLFNKTISKDRRNSFNLDGSMNWWQQVTANASGDLNTWAIFGLHLFLNLMASA